MDLPCVLSAMEISTLASAPASTARIARTLPPRSSVINTKEKNLYHIIPNYLTPTQCWILNSIALEDDRIWVDGRQNSGYSKSELEITWPVRRALNIMGDPWLYDAYLLRYPPGSEIKPHVDPSIPGLCHIRLNVLIKYGIGGTLNLNGVDIRIQPGDAYIFRPDVVTHSVSKVIQDTRLMLSIGANIHQNHAQRLHLV